MNLIRENWSGKKERPVGRFRSNWGKHMDKCKSVRLRRFQCTNRKNVPHKRQAKMETEVGINLDGDYYQRRTGRTPEGEFACFERGGNCRFRGE